MRVTFYRNNSEDNAINKSLTPVTTLNNVVAKGNVDVVNPTIIVEFDRDYTEDINYAYIEDFDSYYFLDRPIAMLGTRCAIQLKRDALETFKSDILQLTAIVDKTEEQGKSNMYLNDGSFVVQSNEYNRVMNFPNGFNENGTFILICAGGD